TDESGIGPLPMGGQLRPCVLRIELDGNTVLSCHRLELGCVDATADDAQTHTLGPGQGADRGAQILGTSDGADVEQVETAAGGSGTVFRSVGCGLGFLCRSDDGSAPVAVNPEAPWSSAGETPLRTT